MDGCTEENKLEGLLVVSKRKAPSYSEGLLLMVGLSRALKIKNNVV